MKIAYNNPQAITVLPNNAKLKYEHDFNCLTEIVKDKNFKPFLKWVGGKTRLIPQYEELGLIPAEFNTYFEPFLGGGAMFFHLQNAGLIQRALLSDLNSDLVNTYKEVKDNLSKLKQVLLKEFAESHDKVFFEEVRNKTFTLDVYNAAKFIYLNKACRSGMYRVNKNGEFNVPMGDLTQKIYQPILLSEANLALNSNNVAVVNTSFFNISHLPQPGDFVFLDPPYHGTFNGYNKSPFGEDEQVKLRDVCREYNENKIKFLLCNSHNSFILDLYNGDEFKINEVWRNGTINSKGTERGKVKELIISNV
jgi:DNA adenine methylase